MPDEHDIVRFNDGDALTEERVREIIREELAAFAAEQRRAETRRID